MISQPEATANLGAGMDNAIDFFLRVEKKAKSR
jgi:hypothetical protein